MNLNKQLWKKIELDFLDDDAKQLASFLSPYYLQSYGSRQLIDIKPCIASEQIKDIQEQCKYFQTKVNIWPDSYYYPKFDENKLSSDKIIKSFNHEGLAFDIPIISASSVFICQDIKALQIDGIPTRNIDCEYICEDSIVYQDYLDFAKKNPIELFFLGSDDGHLAMRFPTVEKAKEFLKSKTFMNELFKDTISLKDIVELKKMVPDESVEKLFEKMIHFYN